jgi:lipopolysaccharide export system protein LptA
VQFKGRNVLGDITIGSKSSMYSSKGSSYDKSYKLRQPIQIEAMSLDKKHDSNDSQFRGQQFKEDDYDRLQARLMTILDSGSKKQSQAYLENRSSREYHENKENIGYNSN